MVSPDLKTKALGEKVHHGLVEYGINVVYLTLVFEAFTEYRRLLLAAHGVAYTNYWVALIEGVVLGKVIMIGGVLRLGRHFETKPLIFLTLYKSVVFSVFVGVFTVIEYVIKGLWKGTGITGGLVDLFGTGVDELLANCLVLLVALIPFFAVKELGRVLGEKRIGTLFFHSIADEDCKARS
jgi:hypothetical protein